VRAQERVVLRPEQRGRDPEAEPAICYGWALVYGCALAILCLFTMMLLCHGFATGQTLDQWGYPPAQSDPQPQRSQPDSQALPNDPGQEAAAPSRRPEPAASSGRSSQLQRQTASIWSREHFSLSMAWKDFRYPRFTFFSADKVVWNRETSEVEAVGNLRVSGGPEDIDITASHGDLRLNSHTARLFTT